MMAKKIEKYPEQKYVHTDNLGQNELDLPPPVLGF
jgi:hypothetical protein